MNPFFIHVGEMLARNGWMFPEEIALVERSPPKQAIVITWREFDGASFAIF